MKSFLNRFGKREEGRGRETLEQGSRVIACADTSTLLAYWSYAGHLTLLFAELIEFYNLIQILRETVSFVFPRVLIFSEMKSRESSRLEGKQKLTGFPRDHARILGDPGAV